MSKTTDHKNPKENQSDHALTIGGTFRVGKKIGCGNFGELRLGMKILRFKIFL